MFLLIFPFIYQVNKKRASICGKIKVFNVLTNTHKGALYKYENGITSPDLETLTNMAIFFDTSIDYLIGNTNVLKKIEEVTPHDLNHDESILIENYRQLPQNYKTLIQSLMSEYLSVLHS